MAAFDGESCSVGADGGVGLGWWAWAGSGSGRARVGGVGSAFDGESCTQWGCGWMADVFIGLGTVVNVATVVVGSLIGIALGDRITERTKDLLTSVLGLITIVLGLFAVASMNSDALADAVGSAGMIIVLIALLLGALLGSWLRVEDRLERAADWLRSRFGGGGDDEAGAHDRRTFVDGLVTATLVFCVGPLTILGSLSDGLGRGADQLLVKAVLDGVAAMAFASALGWGVLASALAVAIIQGSLTLVGYLAGDVLTAAQVDALTAVGGVMLIGLGLRLLDLKQIPVADLLPALFLAPPLVWLTATLL